MTGFGQATGGSLPFRWAVAIHSWNHRFFECSTRLPTLSSGLEEKIRDLIHAHIERGKILVTVSLRSGETETNGLALDEEKIDFYIRAMRRIQKKHRLKEPFSVSALLSVPHLFTVERGAYTVDQYWASLRHVLEEAIRRLLRAKVKEGAALARDLKKRVGFIARFLSRIQSISETLPSKHHKRLRERVLELTGTIPLEGGRLEQEVALLAERSDITEELVRTKHHVDFFKKSLVGSGEIGKKLDFIAQEIHREVNTVASKAQDSEIAEDVIRIKSELEKIREQIQNVE